MYLIINKKESAFSKWSMAYISCAYSSYEIANRELDLLIDKMNMISQSNYYKKADYEIIKIEIVK